MNREKIRQQIHDPNCNICLRLCSALEEVKKAYPSYFCAPVPSFGPIDVELLIVGLAPGLHGANATGRPFTGDHAGLLLFETLHKYGFSNRALSVSNDDGLKLNNCRIINAVKCWPPKNKPTLQEIKNCNGFLKHEIAASKPKIILSLGKVAHEAVLRSLFLRPSDFQFRHSQVHRLCSNGIILINSYHCSRYNTQTGRLSNEMFYAIFDRILTILDS
ncbi:MAG: uracil-DNA glycosylase [Pseudomonadota bacterium]|nr:uracil-DNA glycosylase [Pseudomonadota bacterium]